jgi:hypothetical protein
MWVGGFNLVNRLSGPQGTAKIRPMIARFDKVSATADAWNPNGELDLLDF